MKINAISGLPRAGSTLLCNILNQNPKFFASSTSTISQMVSASSNVFSQGNLEYRMLLQKHDKLGEAPGCIARAAVESWYELLKESGVFSSDVEFVFDKSRGWNHQARALKFIWPESVNIMLVRDPRDVLASIIKQDNKNPMLDIDGNPTKPLVQKIQHEMGVQGRVGSCIVGVMDSVNRKVDNCLYIKYEALAANPKEVLSYLYKRLDLEEFEHDLENIESSSYEMDAFYLNKFPHKGFGEVKAPEPSPWSKVFTKAVAVEIMKSYPQYCEFFGYK